MWFFCYNIVVLNIAILTIPTLQMAVIFLVLAGALYAYAKEAVPIEITSLWTLSFLMIFFYLFPVLDLEGRPTLTPISLLSGFSNPTLITIVSLIIIGAALTETGALEIISSIIARFSKESPRVGMGVTLLIVGIFSAFLNDTPVVVMFIPVIISLAKKLRLSPTRWLMPLSYIAILGGMVTLVGSSTNLLVSAMIVKLSQEPLSFFAFSDIGVVLALSGAIYTLVFLPRRLPKKKLQAQLVSDDRENYFFAKLSVNEVSPLCEKTIVGNKIDGMDVKVFTLKRGKRSFEHPFSGQKILPEDVVSIWAKRDTLLKIANQNINNLSLTKREDVVTKDQISAEIIVSHSSSYRQQTLRDVALQVVPQIIPIGLQRNTLLNNKKDILNIKLLIGDVLLVVGERENIDAIINNTDFILLESSTEEVRHPHHVRRTLSVFLGTIAIAAIGILPLSIATFTGAVLMITLGCISFKEAFKSIDKRIIFLIATALALGLALQQTKGAEIIAKSILSVSSGYGASVVLSIFFLLVMIITNVLSNQATAILFTPIALSLAQSLHTTIEPFVFAVIFAANCSFVTPFSYQTNLLVMNPGQYTFKSYVTSGLPLALLLWILYSVIAPLYFNL